MDDKTQTTNQSSTTPDSSAKKKTPVIHSNPANSRKKHKVTKEIKAEVKKRLDAKPADKKEYQKAAAEARKKVFHWDNKKELVARAIAQHRKSIPQVADQYNISVTQVYHWMKHETFQLRITEHEDLWREWINKHGLAMKDVRIRNLGEMFAATQEIVEARKEHYKGKKNRPGTHTGYVVESFKFKKKFDKRGNPTGETKIVELQFDKGLMDAQRSLQTDVAKELGQLTEKVAVEETTVIREYDADLSQV